MGSQCWAKRRSRVTHVVWLRRVRTLVDQTTAAQGGRQRSRSSRRVIHGSGKCVGAWPTRPRRGGCETCVHVDVPYCRGFPCNWGGYSSHTLQPGIADCIVRRANNEARATLEGGRAADHPYPRAVFPLAPASWGRRPGPPPRPAACTACRALRPRHADGACVVPSARAKTATAAASGHHAWPASRHCLSN